MYSYIHETRTFILGVLTLRICHQHSMHLYVCVCEGAGGCHKSITCTAKHTSKLSSKQSTRALTRLCQHAPISESVRLSALAHLKQHACKLLQGYRCNWRNGGSHKPVSTHTVQAGTEVEQGLV